MPYQIANSIPCTIVALQPTLQFDYQIRQSVILPFNLSHKETKLYYRSH